MKLILCTKCNSVFSLSLNKIKRCDCGKSGGMYTDELNAVFYGEFAIPLGIDNNSLIASITYVKYLQEKAKLEDSLIYSRGISINAFVIPEPCKTFVRKDKE